MIIKKIKYLLIFSLLALMSACANMQKDDAEYLSIKVDAFKEKNNTSLEFLSYISTTKDYSYIIDSSLVVARIIFPDTALMNIKGVTIAVEFNGNEMYQSFPLLKEGASIFIQEGVLIAKGSYYDIETKQAFKRYRLCRTDECRDVARVSLSYMYKYSGVDPAVSEQYQAGDLQKFLVNQELLESPVKKTSK